MLRSLKCGGGRRQFGPQNTVSRPKYYILFTCRRCSIWLPPTSTHFVCHLIMSCRTLRKISGMSRMTPAATCIRTTRYCVSTGVSYTRIFMYPQKWKSNGVRSGERGGLHVQSICYQRYHSSGDTTRSCGTNKVAAEVIRDIPRIFPRVQHDIINRSTKCIEAGVG